MTANITGTGGLGGISLGVGIGISISVDSGLVGSAAVAVAGAAANGAVANIAFASGGGDGSSGRNSIDEGTSSNIPDYIKDNRVPLDKETVLNSKEYQKTNIKVKGAQVYKNGDKYYYRDTFHTGEAAHLEVFDKRGNHIGEANPLTGELIPGTADPTKKINIK